MSDKRYLLKIKIKSLAAESRIIRRAENARKIPSQSAVSYPRDLAKIKTRELRASVRAHPWYQSMDAQREELHKHRTVDLRNASRAAHLAYGFIRGKTVEQIEGKPLNSGIGYHYGVSNEAKRLACKYGNGASKCDTERDFELWQKGGLRVIFEGTAQRLEHPQTKPSAELPAA